MGWGNSGGSWMVLLSKGSGSWVHGCRCAGGSRVGCVQHQAASGFPARGKGALVRGRDGCGCPGRGPGVQLAHARGMDMANLMLSPKAKESLLNKTYRGRQRTAMGRNAHRTK